MNRDGHNNVKFFVGGEVEKTPAFAKRTLFVVGKQSVADIEKQARDNKTPHIFMGANHSFNVDSTDGTMYWNDTITALLDKGFWVTLDYQAHEHKDVLMMLNAGIWQSRLFVPLLSVRIPRVETSSPNLTVKIDDIDFKATNAGVWCMHFKELTDSNRFTDWQEYEADSVLSTGVTKEERKVTTIDVRNLTTTETDSLLNNIKQTFEDTDIKNVSDLGLDIVPTTALKADTEAVAVVMNTIETAADAADAYAAGATVDPLSEQSSKKPRAKK